MINANTIHEVNLNLGIVRLAIKTGQGTGEVWDCINDLKDEIMDADLPNTHRLLIELTQLHNSPRDISLLKTVSSHILDSERQLEKLP